MPKSYYIDEPDVEVGWDKLAKIGGFLLRFYCIFVLFWRFQFFFLLFFFCFTVLHWDIDVDNYEEPLQKVCDERNYNYRDRKTF